MVVKTIGPLAYLIAKPFHLLTGFRIEVQDRSMEPLYSPGTKLWVSRIAYLFKEPARGDIVVLRKGVQQPLLLKRIVALPRESVSWTTRELRVNGVLLEEPYVSTVSVPGDEDGIEWRLGQNEYFVLGDNRLHSADSRQYGPVKRSMVVGKVV
ncbi:MAG: signal peptidase I [Thaumarchaeota archaeon]|nr:signal peptidase I [Nitrososphaerota archaeon]